MSTKDKILDVAEILFAENGFDSVSVRDIVGKAEVNISAISYHFGSKEDLIISVIDRRIKNVNDQRLEKLYSLRKEYNNKTIPLNSLLEAFLQPVFSLGKEDQKNGSKFMKIIGRIISNPNTGLKEKLINMFSEVAKEFLSDLIKTLPNIKPEVVSYRFYFSIGSMAHILMNQEMPKFLNNSSSKLDFENIKIELINFLVGGLSAK